MGGSFVWSINFSQHLILRTNYDIISEIPCKEKELTMKLSVIIPMYNEEKIVEEAITALDAQLLKDFGEGEYEMIFVSDGSRDTCQEKAEAMMDAHPALRVIGYQPNHGKGYAVRTGMLAAEGDFVLFTDCDLAYGTEVIAKFEKAFREEKKDIYIGSRTLDKSGYEGYTLKRKLMSKTYIKYLNIVAGFDHSDSQCGIKGFSQKAAKEVFAECECDRWAFDLEALLIAKDKGFSVGEIAVKIINHRESNISPIHDAIEMTKEVRRIKKRRKAKKKAV